MTVENAPAHSTWPQIPENYRPVVKAGNLAFAKPQTPPSDSQRINGLDLQHLQFMAELREWVSVGLYGGEDSHLFNARDSYNIIDFVSATILSIDEDEITLDFGAVDPREVTLFQARKQASNDIGISVWVTGFGGFGRIQPNMPLSFGPESMFYRKCQPRIRRVVSQASAHVATYKLDQSVEGAMTSSDPDIEPSAYTVKIWNRYGNPPNWLNIQQPTYFLGKYRRRKIATSELPEDKIFLIEPDAAVAHGPGFKGTAFVIEGLNPTTFLWEPIASSEDRLFVWQLKVSGEWHWESRVAFGDAKPEGADSRLPSFSDLTATYEQFRISYWKRDPNGCEAPNYDRCGNARRDYSDSIGNYLLDPAVGGVEIDENGHHWFCSEAVWYDEILTDEWDILSDWGNRLPGPDGIPDTGSLVKKIATGAPNFHAQCKLKGMCDKHKKAENDSSNRGFWRYAYHISRFYVQLLGGCNLRRIQKIPGYSYPSNYEEQAIDVPGMQWQHGFALKTFVGANLHPYIPVLFPGLGLWATHIVAQLKDDGSSYCRKAWAYNWDGIRDETTLATTLSDGGFPTDVPGFKTSRDPLNPAATIEMLELERLGVRNERDTGTILARGLDNWSCVLPPVTLWARGFDLSATEPQENDTVVFERFTA